MVVKYLEKFVENEVPGGFYPASLEELIRDQITKEGKATVVMDASSAANLFYRDLDSICNGQLKSLRRNVVNFAEKLESWGADLVVFYPGTAEYQDLPTWKGKRLGKLEKIFKAFDCMYKGEVVKKVEIQLNSAHIVVKNAFLSLKKCSVLTSTRECDEEVAEFSRENKGVILLAQDSDYMIYDGIDCYASMKSLDLDTLECKIYDRKRLAQHLNLDTRDLPYLATLSGNEIVSEYSLRRFHASLCGRNPRERIFERGPVFRSVANLIVQKDRNLSLIARALAPFRIEEKCLKESLEMYTKGKNRPDLEIDPCEAQVLKVARERTRNCLLSPAIFSVLNKREFRSNNDLEDFRDGKAKPIARILRPLRQRIYGILLFDSEKSSVDEYCVEGAKRKGVYAIDGFEVEAEKPRSDHPGLLRLWEDGSSEMESTKLDLFCEAAGIDLDPEEIRRVPPKFLFPTIALRHLSRLPGDGIFRDQQEVESFLTTALLVSDAEPDSLERIEVKPNARAVRLSSLFLRCCGALQILNQVCGFVVSEEDSCPSNYFDGKMFQMIYAKTESGEHYRDILQGETSLVILFKTLSAIVHYKNDI